MRYLRNIKGKLPQLSLVAILLGLIVLQHYVSARTEQRKKLQDREFSGEVLDELRKMFPDTRSIKQDHNPENVSIVFDETDSPIAHFLVTSPFTDDIKGYAGPIPLLVGIDLENRIVGLTILKNNESINFMNYIRKKGLLQSWNGLTAGEALAKHVDTITAATSSSAAIITSLRKRLFLLPESLRPGKEAPDQSSGSSISDAAAQPDVIAAIMVIVLAAACFARPRSSKKIRPLLLAASVLVLGFWHGDFLSISLFDGWLRQGISWHTVPVLGWLAGLSFLLPLFTSRDFYCTYVCPYGAAQELIGKTGFRKWKTPPMITRVLKIIRRLLLALVVLALLFLPSFDLTFIEPFSAFMFQAAGEPMLVFGAVFLLVSLFRPRAWCRFFCPTGQILEVFTRNLFKGRRA